MTELIDQKQLQLDEVCRKYRVKILELFGSAADETYDPQHSELDFLVNFLPLEGGQTAPDYFGLLHDPEDLFQRQIDLVMERTIQNPYFLVGLNQSRCVIYAA